MDTRTERDFLGPRAIPTDTERTRDMVLINPAFER